MSQETQMLLGLVLGIAVMIVLVMKTKTHTFIALLLAAAITGLVGGMTPSDAVSAISSGFGNTLASTGIIIGLGVMLGGILEKTGGPTLPSRRSAAARRNGRWASPAGSFPSRCSRIPLW